MEENTKIGESQNYGSSGKNLPEKKFRAGAVSATIWQNSGQRQDGSLASFNTISFERGYKDKQGNWKSTSSLRVADIPKAVVVLNKAYEYIVMKAQSSSATLA